MSDAFVPEQLLAAPALAPAWRDWLAARWPELVAPTRNADLPRWQQAVAALPAIVPNRIALAADTVTIGHADQLDPQQRDALVNALRELHPWRKGPFDFFGTVIDTEWRSDWKWQRVVPHLADLSGRRVLDVGCGSGYHLWRMRGAGAAFALGIEPALLYLAQFAAAKKYLPDQPVHIAPAKLEDLPVGTGAFDTVFSMGVLYHRREPLAHLQELKAALRPGGELVLETLVIEHGDLLQPGERYAQMRNVFALPGLATLEQWVQQAGYRRVRVVDVNRTSIQEQRSTDWMRFLSLPDFLDPQDPQRTIEGYPAPVRAIVLAERPD